MIITHKILINTLFYMLYIFTCVACTAEATEQYSESSQHEHDDHDKSTLQSGLNVPDSNVSSYSVSSLQPHKQTNFTCILNSPYQVHRYEFTCEQAEYLDVTVADCCIEGDLWQAKATVWDQKPNTAVTVNPKAINEKSVVARVYNYGGTARNPKKLTALIECSYRNGVNSFPAAALFTADSDGYCTMKDLGASIGVR